MGGGSGMIGLIGRLGSCLPFSWLQPGPGGPLFLPFYHLVSEEPAPHIRHLYPVCSIQRFRADLEWMLRYYEPVGLEELERKVKNGRPVVHLSFDDGLRQCAEVIAPILWEKGIPATFFINPSFVGNRALMYRYKASLLVEADPAHRVDYLSIGYRDRGWLDERARQVGVDFELFLREYRPYMGLDQLDDLVRQGFNLGGHSMDHPMYRALTLEDQVRQTLESVDWVRSRWGVTAAFAFPFTDDGVLPAFFDKIPADWRTFGTAGFKLDELARHWQRVPMERYIDPMSRVVPGIIIAYWLKRWIGRSWVRR